MKPQQLQYICRSQFNTGIPGFTKPFRSPEQIEQTIPTLRKLMLQEGIPDEEYIAVFRATPQRFGAPDELSFYLGFSNVLFRKQNYEGKPSIEEISTEDFTNRLLTGTIYNHEGEYGINAAGRFLLNSSILLSHPRVIVSHSEVERNKEIYGIWENKFPADGCIEPVSEKIIYGGYGEMNTAETLEFFSEQVTGKETKLPPHIRKKII